MHCFTTGLLLVVLLQLQLQFHQDLNLFNHDDGSTKNKRGVLPKHATNVMRSWLFQHIGVSPGHAPQQYPSEFLNESPGSSVTLPGGDTVQHCEL